MMGLPIRIEHANLVAVQRLHDADPRQHCRPARLRDQEQRLHRRLPLRRLVLGLLKLRDVFAGILERDELATVGQRDRLVEGRDQSGRDLVTVGWRSDLVCRRV
jgi:hypothetical protein